uniref:Uncharacterized protein n=1 Tax=Arabidopsis thaliana TaxID=3702 RepID=Q0WVH2_ARATH|nr:hypothetical protein [Arabidopsis thaliana]
MILNIICSFYLINFNYCCLITYIRSYNICTLKLYILLFS